MALTPNEVMPGAIAYFAADVLNGDAAVSITGSPVSRRGTGNQFVCYKVDGDVSYWASLTATYRRERLPIQPEWVVNGYGPLGGGAVFLQDGRTTYKGPTASFVAAATGETPFLNGRPHLLPPGVQEVVRVVTERGGQL